MTTTALSAVEGTTDDLVQISTVMHTYIKEKNDQALEVALEQINQKPALVKRLFPTAYDKETQRINVERMRDLARRAASR